MIFFLIIESPSFYADIKREKQSAREKMEKEIIINFLNEYWDEFAAIVSDSPISAVDHTFMGCFPDDLYEFASLLSKILAMRQMHTTDKQKGLLKRAQQFRKSNSLYNEGEYASIIVKNGLFTVQSQQYNETLDSSFKTLVDSVL